MAASVGALVVCGHTWRPVLYSATTMVLNLTGATMVLSLTGATVVLNLTGASMVLNTHWLSTVKLALILVFNCAG